jgi:hypothetical protein
MSFTNYLLADFKHPTTESIIQLHQLPVLPLSLLQPMPQHPANRQEACSHAVLTSQALHQHDLHHSALQYDAADGATVEKKKYRSRLESGFNDVTVDLPSYIKDKVTENDIGSMFVPPCASLVPPIGYNPHTHDLVTETTFTHINGYCHSHSTWSIVHHPDAVGSDTEDKSEDRFMVTEEQYSFQYLAAGPKVKDWGYDLRGIGMQFSDLEFKEYVVCH